jgi:uncharacterized protein (TIGR02391 family)
MNHTMAGLIDFAPTVSQLLEIEPEDLGLILIRLMQDVRQPNFTVSEFEMPIWNANSPGYPPQNRQAVSRAIAEAWQWLQYETLIMPDPDHSSDRFCLTRRGRRLNNAADIEAYGKRQLLPSSSMHPILIQKVRGMFLRGDYDLATFEAFKQVEIAARSAASLPADLDSIKVVRTAFNADNGALTETSAVMSERQALAHLFAGAIGHAKNPGSHRTVNLTAAEAAALIWLASYLLGIVDARSRKDRR